MTVSNDKLNVCGNKGLISALNIREERKRGRSSHIVKIMVFLFVGTLSSTRMKNRFC